MSQEMKTRREALKKGAAFVIPTITAFKLSTMAVACSGNFTNNYSGNWNVSWWDGRENNFTGDGWCGDGDTKSWGGTWGTWEGWGGWGW